MVSKKWGLRSNADTRPSWLPRSRFPFESRFLEIQGCQVHFVDEGEGTPLLLLHGNPTWSFLYRGVIQRLSREFRCVALDYPGFGLSKAPSSYDFRPSSHAQIVEEFIQKLGLKDMVLMGQDWGGPIGLQVATRHPDWFRGFIIGNTFAWPVNGDPHFERFSKFMGGPIGGFLIRNFNSFVNILIPASMKRRRLPRDIMAAYRGPFPTRDSREPTHVFPREILRSADFLSQVEAGLPKLADHPALILWGDRDIAFRERERKRFESIFLYSRTVILKGSGHFIQEEAPDEIAHAIQSWWKEVNQHGREYRGYSS